MYLVFFIQDIEVMYFLDFLLPFRDLNILNSYAESLSQWRNAVQKETLCKLYKSCHFFFFF